MPRCPSNPFYAESSNSGIEALRLRCSSRLVTECKRSLETRLSTNECARAHLKIALNRDFPFFHIRDVQLGTYKAYKVTEFLNSVTHSTLRLDALDHACLRHLNWREPHGLVCTTHIFVVAFHVISSMPGIDVGRL